MIVMDPVAMMSYSRAIWATAGLWADSLSWPPMITWSIVFTILPRLWTTNRSSIWVKASTRRCSESSTSTAFMSCVSTRTRSGSMWSSTTVCPVSKPEKSSTPTLSLARGSPSPTNSGSVSLKRPTLNSIIAIKLCSAGTSTSLFRISRASPPKNKIF